MLSEFYEHFLIYFRINVCKIKQNKIFTVACEM